MSKAMPKTDDEWEVSSATDTLVRAEEIKADAKLMKKVKTEIARRAEATKKAAHSIGAKLMSA